MNSKTTSLLDSFELKYERLKSEDYLARQASNWRTRMKRRKQRKDKTRVHKSNT
nr:MAG TPA: hypothetical protein [Caudoviricetes sp.]